MTTMAVQMECGDAEFGEVLYKDHLRFWSRDGHVQFRYVMYLYNITLHLINHHLKTSVSIL